MQILATSFTTCNIDCCNNSPVSTSYSTCQSIKFLHAEEEASDSGSEEGNDSTEGSGDEDEDSRPLRKRKLSLDERRQERAAGDHPLQQRFKELSRGLLKKHTGEVSDGRLQSLLTCIKPCCLAATHTPLFIFPPKPSYHLPCFLVECVCSERQTAMQLASFLFLRQTS